MELWDDLYNDLESSKKKQLFNCEDDFSQLSPDLIKILYVSKIFPKIGLSGDRLFRIHCLLGLSWNELREAISPLRGLLRDDATSLHMLLLNPEAAFLQTVDFSSLLLSLAKGGLHVTKAMNDRSLGSVLCHLDFVVWADFPGLAGWWPDGLSS
jgi:hypothetical protein